MARSIIDGVIRLCAECGRVIVMEEDLIHLASFLSYMNDVLTRYENEARVMQIAGYMFPVNLDLEEDALFLPFLLPGVGRRGNARGGILMLQELVASPLWGIRA